MDEDFDNFCSDIGLSDVNNSDTLTDWLGEDMTLETFKWDYLYRAFQDGRDSFKNF